MKYLVIIVLLFSFGAESEKTILTFGIEDEGKEKLLYEYNLLVLAMEVTREEYGDFALTSTNLGTKPTYSRLKILAEDNKFENLIYMDSASNEMVDSLYGIPFPVDLGATSYRVGLVSPESKIKIKNIDTMEEVKKITVIQGRGWLDGEILRSNGFTVVVGSYDPGLLHMAANNRADIFLIGANELKREWQKKSSVEYLEYDENICIYYPLPKFFFMNRSNKTVADRVHMGLKRAFESGELIKLWERYYGEQLRFSNLKQRKIFKFENPFIDQIDKDYEQYMLNPETI